MRQSFNPDTTDANELSSSVQGEIDPQFQPYLREPPRISYTQPEDPWFRRRLVSSLEAMLGRNKIEKTYYRLKESPFSISQFSVRLCAKQVFESSSIRASLLQSRARAHFYLLPIILSA